MSHTHRQEPNTRKDRFAYNAIQILCLCGKASGSERGKYAIKCWVWRGKEKESEALYFDECVG